MKQTTTHKTEDHRREACLDKSEEGTSSDEELETPSHHEEVPYPDLDSDEEDKTPEVVEKHQGYHKKLVPETPAEPQTPILLPHERKQAKELGHSLDTKLLNDEFFFVDLEKMWFWLAISIQRHIHFSRGFLFLDDLATYLKRGGRDEDCDPDELSHNENELRFSYCFPDQLKLTQLESQKKRKNYGNRSSEETWNIKRAIDMDEENKNWVFPDIYSKDESIENLEAFLQKEGYSHKNHQRFSSHDSSLKSSSVMSDGKIDLLKVNNTLILK